MNLTASLRLAVLNKKTTQDLIFRVATQTPTMCPGSFSSSSPKLMKRVGCLKDQCKTGDCLGTLGIYDCINLWETDC